MTGSGMVDAMLPVALGLALAAACGMRVFVPLLAVSIASASGFVPLAHGFEFLGTRGALIVLATATTVEVVAYAVPWLDHALDVLATPTAVLAGIVASASVMVDVPPLVKWTVVLVGGGGLAGLTQGATVLARIKSGALTGGLANPLVSLTELLGAVAISATAIVAPIVALVVVSIVLLLIFRRAGRLLFGRRSRDPVIFQQDR